MNIQELQEQNPWWLDRESIQRDPKIEQYKNAHIQYNPMEILEPDYKKNAVYLIYGPRQVGKTTAIKLLIKKLLEADEDPRAIFYYACDVVFSAEKLLEILRAFRDIRKPETKRFYVILDEISVVDKWPHAIKYCIDQNLLPETTFILTGSNSYSSLNSLKIFLRHSSHGGFKHGIILWVIKKKSILLFMIIPIDLALK